LISFSSRSSFARRQPHPASLLIEKEGISVQLVFGSKQARGVYRKHNYASTFLLEYII
jgi:hypothetical protein